MLVLLCLSSEFFPFIFGLEMCIQAVHVESSLQWWPPRERERERQSRPRTSFSRADLKHIILNILVFASTLAIVSCHCHFKHFSVWHILFGLTSNSWKRENQKSVFWISPYKEQDLRYKLIEVLPQNLHLFLFFFTSVFFSHSL